MTINSIKIIYIGIILCILLYVFKCIHAYAWGYKLVAYKVLFLKASSNHTKYLYFFLNLIIKNQRKLTRGF